MRTARKALAAGLAAGIATVTIADALVAVADPGPVRSAAIGYAHHGGHGGFHGHRYPGGYGGYGGGHYRHWWPWR